MIDTKDCLHCWRLLGIEYQGYEVVGVKRISRADFLKLTEDLLQKERKEKDLSCRTQNDYDAHEARNIFRLLEGSKLRQKEVNGRVGRDTLYKFVSSCDIQYVNEQELGAVFESIAGGEEAEYIEEPQFTRFLAAQIGRKREEIEEDSAS